jgi:hypothetical protein
LARSVLDVNRAGDASAALKHAFENRRGRCINVGDALKIELEVGWMTGECGGARVFQSAHVCDAEPTADHHTEYIAMTGRADPRHISRCPQTARPRRLVVVLGGSLPAASRGRTANTTVRETHEISSINRRPNTKPTKDDGPTLRSPPSASLRPRTNAVLNSQMPLK